MRRHFLAVTLIIIMLLSAIPTTVLGTDSLNIEQPKLSEQTQEMQIDFLRSKGIEFDAVYNNFAIKAIATCEQNPSYKPISYNNPEIWRIAEEISSVVNEYYHDNVNVTANTMSLSVSALNDSTVIGSWNSSYTSYNCYAYAVYRTDAFYWPGKFSGVTNFNVNNYNASELASHVYADLKSSEFSNKCVILTTEKPSSVASDQYVICIRKGPDDFHLMRSGTGSVWRHKPGGTNPLKYKYSNPASTVWTNECYVNGTYFSGDTYYDSEIYYLIYRQGHGATTNKLTGQQYHSGSRHFYQYGDKCNDCGDFENKVWRSRACAGPPCAGTVSILSLVY